MAKAKAMQKLYKAPNTRKAPPIGEGLCDLCGGPVAGESDFFAVECSLRGCPSGGKVHTDCVEKCWAMSKKKRADIFGMKDEDLAVSRKSIAQGACNLSGCKCFHPSCNGKLKRCFRHSTEASYTGKSRKRAPPPAVKKASPTTSPTSKPVAGHVVVLRRSAKKAHSSPTKPPTQSPAPPRAEPPALPSSAPPSRAPPSKPSPAPPRAALPPADADVSGSLGFSLFCGERSGALCAQTFASWTPWAETLQFIF